MGLHGFHGLLVGSLCKRDAAPNGTFALFQLAAIIDSSVVAAGWLASWPAGWLAGRLAWLADCWLIAGW